MGNYWEPIDDDLNPDSPPARYGYTASGGETETGNGERAALAPIQLRGLHEASDEPERRGGNMSQYGGPGRPTGPGDYGGGAGSGNGDDDDRFTAPFSEAGDQDPHGSERTPFGYQPEERYWTDYLRIAAPVVGVILMLGLVWFWVANMLTDDNDDIDNGDEDLAGEVIEADTPEATDEETDDEQEPITVMTPEPEDDADDAENGDDAAPTTMGPGATVVVVGTGEAGLNIRSSASTEAEVVNSVPDGTEMVITGESEEADGFTWWPVEVDDTTGFVAADFIELPD